MSVVVEAQPSGFGATVRGVDLAKPLPLAELTAVRAAWLAHGVVAFPGQVLTHEALEGFTRQLGEFGDDPYIEAMPGYPNILEIRREAEEKAVNFGAGWHSDWSFQATPPSATILHAKVVPPVGGDTLYADGEAAWAALSPVFQGMLAPLYGVHSARRPYGPSGSFASETRARAMKILPNQSAEATQRHPLVRVHPETGRTSLFINPVYTLSIDGMRAEESNALLLYLFKHMTAEAFQYRHRWSANMLTMWDNRRVMHLAEGGYDGHRRVLHRTTVAGDVPVGPPLESVG